MHYNYQARTKTGDVKTGFIDASSKQAAAELLRREGLFVTSLKRQEEGFKRSFGFFGHVSQKDIALFARQLSVMFKANVSLVEALRTIGGQNSNARFRENILMISKDVEGGTTLSAAFAKYPDIFSAFFISMVRAGEVSGNLSEQLFYLSEYLEKQYYLAGKVRSAMVYPSVILAVVVAVIFLLSYFVMPNLVSMLEASNTALPPVTQFVIWFSGLLRGPGGIVFLLGLVAIGVLAFRYSRTEQGKSFIDRLILKIPGVRNMFGMLYLDRFADNLSILIVGGIPITQALEITSTIVGNVVYREVIQKTVEGVRQGQTISSVLFNYPELFPPTFTQMILVGEQTGSLDKSLLTMVSFYEKETDRAIDTLLTLMEPALIIVLGIIVGGLVGSVMIPLYQSMGNM